MRATSLDRRAMPEVEKITDVTPQRRGFVDTKHTRQILEAREKLDRARDATDEANEGLRRAVVQALAAGGSIREVAAVAGVTPKTIQEWKR